jgi:hypothetical protein
VETSHTLDDLFCPYPGMEAVTRSTRKKGMAQQIFFALITPPLINISLSLSAHKARYGLCNKPATIQGI